MTQQGPNPQTNLIFSIVAPVVALIGVAIIYFTKPVPATIAAPAPVNVSAAKLPSNAVVMANALPNAGSTNGSPSASGGGLAGGGGGGFVPGGPPRAAGTSNGATPNPGGKSGGGNAAASK